VFETLLCPRVKALKFMSREILTGHQQISYLYLIILFLPHWAIAYLAFLLTLHIRVLTNSVSHAAWHANYENIFLGNSQCCGSRMLIPDPDFFTSRIQDLAPGSNKTKGKFFYAVLTFLVARNFTKLKIILF
jgi:hypothetical protein